LISQANWCSWTRVFLPQVNGAIPALGEELRARLNNRDWSDEVCDVALYFALNGESGLECFCLDQLERDLLGSGKRHFISLLVAVSQKSESRVILDLLMQAWRISPDSFTGEAFVFVASILYLGRKGIRREHVEQMIQFCVQNRQNLKRNSVRDRLAIAFLCRLLSEGRGQEGSELWQGVFQLVMTIVNQWLSDGDMVGNEKPFCNAVKYHKLLCGDFLWVFQEWNVFVGIIVQGLREVKPS
jgi:hypothetical protein